MNRQKLRVLCVVAFSGLSACGSSDDDPVSGSGGSAGTGGAASGGAGGNAGTAATGGTAGSASGGASGASTGGTAGASGNAGASGAGGSGGAPPLPGSSITAAPYDCKCDGSTNASSCINAALADFANWKNQTLEFPQGATCIAVALNWKDPVGTPGAPYVLRGNGATIKAPDGYPVVSGNWLLRLEGGRYITIQGLKFDGNRGNRTPAETVAHNIYVRGSQDVLLDGIQSSEAVTDGLYVGASDQADPKTYPLRITVKDPVISHAYRNNISIINCDTCEVLGDGNGSQASCQLIDAKGTMPQAGIDFEPNPVSASPGIVNSRVEGCYIAHNEGACVMLTAVAGSVDTIVRKNTLEDCRRNAATCGSGVIVGHKGALIEDNVFKNFTIASTCRSLVDFGANGSSNVTSATVRNNQFQNITGGRILYIHSANAGGHAFKDNVMTNIGVSASGDWCNAGNTPNPNDISGNTVDGKLQSPNPGCP
ncbi:MAG: hypothetical protein KC776_25245 [Myxococcales bacterium]|nr:hypothetical protein [Myxococcales bacterium]MCB9581814.1 hypothetical protein [Polyangiaceae bacterium]